jgi:hypothetical protein
MVSIVNGSPRPLGEIQRGHDTRVSQGWEKIKSIFLREQKPYAKPRAFSVDDVTKYTLSWLPLTDIIRFAGTSRYYRTLVIKCLGLDENAPLINLNSKKIVKYLSKVFDPLSSLRSIEPVVVLQDVNGSDWTCVVEHTDPLWFTTRREIVIFTSSLNSTGVPKRAEYSVTIGYPLFEFRTPRNLLRLLLGGDIFQDPYSSGRLIATESTTNRNLLCYDIDLSPTHPPEGHKGRSFFIRLFGSCCLFVVLFTYDRTLSNRSYVNDPSFYENPTLSRTAVVCSQLFFCIIVLSI